MQTKESVFGLFLFLYLTANTFYLRTSDIDSVFYARVQYRIFAISLSFDQIGESYICVTYFSNKERYEGGCCERKCGSRNLCDKQRQWLLFLIFNNLIRRVTGKFYLLENSYFNVEKGSLFSQSVEARWCSGETMNGSTRLAKPTLPGLDYQTRCLEQFS